MELTYTPIVGSNIPPFWMTVLREENSRDNPYRVQIPFERHTAPCPRFKGAANPTSCRDCFLQWLQGQSWIHFWDRHFTHTLNTQVTRGDRFVCLLQAIQTYSILFRVEILTIEGPFREEV